MDSHVYVIGGNGMPHVKIGTSTDLEARLKQLQPGAPVRLEVLWSTPGDSGLERQVHARLDNYRTYREWFDLTPLGDPVLAVQEAVRSIQGESHPCLDPETCYGGPCLCRGFAR